DLEGTHLWRSTSPFRPKHKRKNWYFSLQCYEESQIESIDKTKIIYQTMKSPKKGGQHVNTTSSGVRALYPSLNIEAISYDERSQHQNKKIAQDRLLKKIALISLEQIDKEALIRWKEGKEITRGNPVKVFEGTRFMELKKY
ncbi:MAG: peptide chain release factor-like protein, partial [Sulfurovaceae bacterium]